MGGRAPLGEVNPFSIPLIAYSDGVAEAPDWVRVKHEVDTSSANNNSEPGNNETLRTDAEEPITLHARTDSSAAKYIFLTHWMEVVGVGVLVTSLALRTVPPLPFARFLPKASARCLVFNQRYFGVGECRLWCYRRSSW